MYTHPITGYSAFRRGDSGAVPLDNVVSSAFPIGWNILNPGSTVIASSATTHGWSVTFDGSNFTISVPNNAAVPIAAYYGLSEPQSSIPHWEIQWFTGTQNKRGYFHVLNVRPVGAFEITEVRVDRVYIDATASYDPDANPDNPDMYFDFVISDLTSAGLTAPTIGATLPSTGIGYIDFPGDGDYSIEMTARDSDGGAAHPVTQNVSIVKETGACMDEFGNLFTANESGTGVRVATIKRGGDILVRTNRALISNAKWPSLAFDRGVILLGYTSRTDNSIKALKSTDYGRTFT